jgi:hypothetical protein
VEHPKIPVEVVVVDLADTLMVLAGGQQLKVVL